MQEEWKSYATFLAGSIVTIAAMKWLVPFWGPFVAAFFLVIIFHPFLCFIHGKTKISKGILFSFFLLLFLGGILLGLWLLGKEAFYQLQNLSGHFPKLMEQVGKWLSGCCNVVGPYFQLSGAELSQMVEQHFIVLGENIKVTVVPKLADGSFRCVKEGIGIVGNIFLAIAASILLLKDYESMKENMKKVKPLSTVMDIFQRIGKTGKKYVQAQGKIMGLISVVCIAGFWILKVRNFILGGLLVGLLDALPLIGTGTILIPWALGLFLFGNWKKAMGLLVIYVICTLIRQFLEPKIVGEKLGVYPFYIMLAIISGLKLYGLGGIVLGPLTFLILWELWNQVMKRTKQFTE